MPHSHMLWYKRWQVAAIHALNSEPRLPEGIVASVPRYRMSKVQALLFYAPLRLSSVEAAGR